jgi:hypothetical protein
MKGFLPVYAYKAYISKKQKRLSPSNMGTGSFAVM